MGGSQFTLSGWPVVGPLIVAGVLVGVAVLAHRGVLTLGRAVTLAMIGSYVAAVVGLTLLPIQVQTGVYANTAVWWQKVNLVPVLTIDPATFVLNIVMTVPLGVLACLVLRVRSVWTVAAVGLAFSGAVELLQTAGNVWLSSGRTGDVNDLVANVAGAMAGYWLLRGSCRLKLVANAVTVFNLPKAAALRWLGRAAADEYVTPVADRTDRTRPSSA